MMTIASRKIACSLIFILVSLYVILLSGCNSNTSKQTKFSDEEIKELDEYLESIQNNLPVPGIAVAIIKDNAVYYKTSGKAQSSIPFTDSTVFFTGTISELMVSTAIIKLAEAGKIDLDDPIVEHLPYFKLGDSTFHTITIRHLLTQTGGIPHHSAVWDLPYFESDALAGTTQSIRLQPGKFVAGTSILRSPYNYDILADLIQYISGSTFEEYTKKNVLLPLDLSHSTFYKPEIPEGELAKPFRVNDWLTYSMKEDSLYPYNREHAGSLGFHSSIKDMSNWLFMLLNEGKSSGNTLLKKEFNRELVKAQFRTDSTRYIGLAWEIEKTGNKMVFNKNHKMGGFSADVLMIPEDKMGVLVVSNTSEDFNLDIIRQELLDWLNGKELRPFKMPVNIAMGKTLNETDNLDSALHTYKRLQISQPDKFDFSAAALSQLGVNLLYRENDSEKAIKVFQFCSEMFPGSSYAQLNLVEAYLLDKNFEQAQSALVKAKELGIKSRELSKRANFLEETIRSNTKKEKASS